MFVPAQEYVHQLEQLIDINYRVGTPQEAEVFQHELQSVVEYNEHTLSAYYPVYMTTNKTTTPKETTNA